MKREQLLQALGQVDEKYIDAAAPGRKKSGKWIRIGAMAACFCVVIGVALAMPNLMQKSESSDAMETEIALEYSDAEVYPEAISEQNHDTAEVKESPSSTEAESAEPEEMCSYPLRGFDEMVASREQETSYICIETVATYTQVPVGERTANYELVYNMDSDRLTAYVGTLYPNLEDGYHWYYPAEKTNLKYLIRVCDRSGEQTLWIFRGFVVDDAKENAYTYGDVYREIYGVESSNDIVSITANPSTANNTELGIQIQEVVGTTVYTEREDLEEFYAITSEVLCYGESDWADYYAAENQYTYSFSTDAEDKLGSGEETYGTRYLTVTLADGTTIDSWKYNALRGCFYEFGGIGTKALTAENVQALNELFGIS